MFNKSIQTLSLFFLSAGILSAQHPRRKPDSSYKCFAGSSAFILGNFTSNSPSFYQLNFGYRLTPADVISLEAITWRYDAPLGIPYGPSHGNDSENYPGSVREYGVGVTYQRFLWKGLYSSLLVIPFKRVFLDENNNKIQKGFRLFSTFRVGYHITFFKNRFFAEPSLASNYWPVSTNVPQTFAVKDAKWNKYFLFEPGLHFGIKF